LSRKIGAALKPIAAAVSLSHLTFADLVDYLVALNRLTCTTELTKMLLGTDPFLDRTVILLQDVVQILNRPMTAALSQDSFSLGFINR
jgi:hypothetical protein